ncbi:non-ribosomal peptide synthetase [Gordonia insulae]|uniref:Dimodular nonribosomal peptide synthase n=1 Tax=Gordonia insulae TaxID=2420509 RepID=A0A3G8JH25_9ACTN|nr:non-ribosomal peptide synthetase [Gordonia insulae]AZG44376.1 Dimodular nonribosomal peptide synthase [Gordonia insulae]
MRASAAQRGLWFAQSLLPSSSVFTVGQLIDFGVAPDHARLLAAVQAAIDEADGLRSRFTERRDGDVSVDLGGPIPVSAIDLGDDPAAIDCHAGEAVRTVVEPAVGPCASATVLTAGNRIALLLIAHHIVLDAYGLGLLGRRIGRLYADPEDDRRLRPVTELPVDVDAARPGDQEFWTAELSGVDGPLTLSDRPRGHRVATRVRTVRVTVAGAGALTRSPARLTAAIAAFCSRRAETTDVVVGFPMMNRLGSPAANVPCTTVNVVPLRIEVRPGQTVDELADRVGEKMRAIAPHARYRGEDIVRDLRRRGVDGAVGPTINIKPFGAGISFGRDPDGREIGATVASLARGPVVDLSVTALDLPSGDLELLLDADADLYGAEEISDVADTLRTFVTTFLDDLRPRCGGIPLDASGEQARVTAIRTGDARATVRTDPTPVATRIAGQPDHLTAAVCGAERLTFGELNRRADDLASRIGPCGGEDIVAIRLPRGLDLVVALVAVLRSGAAFLPLDPGFPADRLAATLDDAQPVAVIEPGVHGPNVGRHRHVRQSPSRARADARADAAAYVIYTSGSTGTPKGVVVGHGALVNFTDAMIRDIGHRPGTSMLAVTTISFDIAILETLVPLAAGASVVVATPDEVHDPGRLADLIVRHGVTHMQATPSLWSAFLDGGHGRTLAGVDVLVGGEQLPPEVASGLVATARSVRNMYGPTETTIWSTTAPVRAGHAVCIGGPIDNTGIRVLDATLHPVRAGRVGELYLSGAGLARGYHRLGAMTAQRFVADPYGPSGSRMYRTGDLVRTRVDGSLECLGRTDHQVKVRGFRIELGEVESVLAEHHSVEKAVATTVGGRLVGYVTAAPGNHIDPAAVRTDLAARLPDYMLPAAIVTVHAFPLTPNGKIDRRALPAPDFAGIAGHTRPPETDTERTLAEVFAAVLGVARVGADDSFFLLGGDSITAVRLVAAAAQAGLQITPLEVFDGPTVARLAAVARPISVEVPASGAPGPGTIDQLTTAGIDSAELDELMDGNLL